MQPILQNPVLDELLQAHAAALGADATAYRNHCLRVLNYYCWLRTPDEDELRHAAVALAFHDLGIWTDGTFDYLAPSARRMRDWVAAQAPDLDADLIEAMILQHHKITPWRGERREAVEALRRADWIDVLLGMAGYGVSRQFRREVMAALPDAGFHWRLVQLSSRRLLTRPWSPMPMMRW
ncbi:MAG TPA: hypothetical protein VLI06_00700 [Solimonas sp.]|nr:hypothetical protein [Solimonas sp.]